MADNHANALQLQAMPSIQVSEGPDSSTTTSPPDGSQSPIRKRARYESGSSGSMGLPSSCGSSSDILEPVPPGGMGDCSRDTEMQSTVQSMTSFKRDSTYYMEDGSCILLVEDTLFNVRPAVVFFECN